MAVADELAGGEDRRLVKAGEILAVILVTEHNLTFYQEIMGEMREAIGEERFASFASDFRRDYTA